MTKHSFMKSLCHSPSPAPTPFFPHLPSTPPQPAAFFEPSSLLALPTPASLANKQKMISSIADFLHSVLTFNHFLQTLSHNMDIFNSHKLKLDILIKISAFISFPSCFICHGIDLQRQQRWVIWPALMMMMMHLCHTFHMIILHCVLLHFSGDFKKIVIPLVLCPRCTHT